MGEEVIAARLFASARESAGRGCETHVPFVGCRVVAGDRRSSTRGLSGGEPRAVTQGVACCRRWVTRNDGVGGGQDDGGELLQVEVALIAVIEDNVPDEFVVCGDVMVCDHAV